MSDDLRKIGKVNLGPSCMAFKSIRGFNSTLINSIPNSHMWQIIVSSVQFQITVSISNIRVGG